jgi:hypothetical protein
MLDNLDETGDPLAKAEATLFELADKETDGGKPGGQGKLKDRYGKIREERRNGVNQG